MLVTLSAHSWAILRLPRKYSGGFRKDGIDIYTQGDTTLCVLCLVTAKTNQMMCFKELP